MTLQQRIFKFVELADMAVMLGALVRGRGQFAVSPWPQGINDQQEGWVVSFPPEVGVRA